MTVRTFRFMIAAVIVLGLAAFLGAGSTTATFSDAHDGQGSLTATDKFFGSLTADAGGSYTVQEGSGWLTLDASKSSSAQGTIQRYDWTLLSGPGGGWYYPSQPYAYYDVPTDVQGPTQAVVELTVTNNKGETATDTATITIQDANGINAASVRSATNASPGRKRGGTRQTFGNNTG